MAIFSIGARTSGATSGTPAQEIYSSANAGYSIKELGISLAGATASAFGFGRPSASAVTPTTPVTVLPEDIANTTGGNTLSALAWGTAPAAPTGYNRRCSLPAAIGAGILWTFPRGFNALKGGSGPNGSVVIENLGANTVIDTWVVVDE